MRILNKDDDKALHYVTIFLEKEEAETMLGALEQMLKKEKPHINSHQHVNDDKFEHEITLTIYKRDEVDAGYNERSKDLISKDK